MLNINRIRWVCMGWAAFGLALFAVTWRVWVGSSVGGSDFPHVPLLEFGHKIPRAFDNFGFGILLLTLVAIATAVLPQRPRTQTANDRQQKWNRVLIAVFCVALILMICVNQHRLQPWAYLALIVGGILFSCRENLAVRLLRIVAIGIYFHSAVSKLDFEFTHSLGPTFLASATRLVGFNASEWSETAQVVGALTFPLIELLVAIGLCFHPTRRAAVILGCVMHGLLVVMFSPWGTYPQEWAVLIWNLYFMWQLVFLFSFATSTSEATKPEPARTATTGSIMGWFLTALAVAAPLLEPLQLFDHWPSWGLYAPRHNRVVVFIEDDAKATLPAEFQSALTPAWFTDPDFTTISSRLSLNRLSLDLLQVPTYPQARFQLAAAIDIAERFELDDAIHVELQTAAKRLNGDREKTLVHGVAEMKEAAKQFRLNAEPR